MGGAMPAYRAYLVDGQSHIRRAPHKFESDDDEEAITQAKQFVDGHDVELWEHDRVVALIDADGVMRRLKRAPVLGSDTCRKLAEECRAHAERTTDARLKRQDEEMARAWLALACRAEDCQIADDCPERRLRG
jgi:hypothetical protein